MLRFVGWRLLHVIPVLLGVSFIVFLSLYLLPGDVTQQILGLAATEERAAALREKMGLDRNILVQYGLWLLHLLQFDLGVSPIMRVPVATVMLDKIRNSLILMGASLAIVISVSLVLATMAAARFRKPFDKVVLAITFVLASVPVFWFGLVLAYLFGVHWRIFPLSGMYTLASPGGIGDVLYHLVLPAVTTAATSVAIVTRVTRSALIDVLAQPFVLSARARGLSSRRVVLMHGVRNVLPTFANLCGLQIGYLFGGAVFSEIVFGWPGIGLQLYDSILARDTQMVQGAVLSVAVVFVLGNLLADIAVYALDPRRK